MTETITVGDPVEQQGRVLRCRVTAGGAGALDDDCVIEVTKALRGLATGDQAEQAGIGAVLLVHEGRNFCAGGNVRAFAAAGDRAAYLREIAGAGTDLIEAYVRCAVPTVAAVQGWAAGAGMSIVLATDVVIAGHGTRLRPAYPGIGFSPDLGMSWTLPRIVGHARARRILLTDAVLDAEALLGLGIAAEVVDDDRITAEAVATAERFAAGPTHALGRIKALLADTWHNDLRTQLDREVDAISASADGAEGREGVDAFVARRPPAFH